MINKIIIIIRHLVVIGHWRSWMLYVTALFVIITPALTIRFVSHEELKEDLTALSVARRQNIALSVAEALEEQLNQIEDFALAISTHPSVQQAAIEQRWDDAIEIAAARLDLNSEPFIDRIFIADAAGIGQSDKPALPGVRGTNFSHREWYQDVIGTGRPTVTSVYIRTAEPTLPVVTAAAPVTDEANTIVAIVAAQLTLEHFADWTKNIKIGSGGFIYIVDQKGQIVAHPKYDTSKEITDFSNVPVVRHVMTGETGVTVAYNPIEGQERLTAFAPVGDYGWGVLAQEPTDSAFAGREQTLKKFRTLELLVGIWNFTILVFMMAVIHRLLQFLFTLPKSAVAPSKTKKQSR